MSPILALSALLAATTALAGPRPFETDGCTRWRDGPSRNPTQWRHCCVRHDLRFWAGGTPERRAAADLELRDCVAATGARREAELIYLGVRIGARSPRKLPGKQWGNAWSYRATRSTTLDAGEIDLLEDEILDPRYDLVLDLEARRSLIEDLRRAP